MNDLNFVDNNFNIDILDPLPTGEESKVVTNTIFPKPTKLSTRQRKRKLYTAMQREALIEFIGELPPEDTDIWIIGNGSGATYGRRVKTQAFEFGHFIPVLIDLLGGHVTDLYISTWTMNRHHAENILQIYDEKKADRITVLTDPYFLKRESFVANTLKSGLLTRGQRILAFKNHTKIIAMATPDGKTCTIQGSANLSSTPRAENWVLTTAPEVYHWTIDSFFEEMIKNA